MLPAKSPIPNVSEDKSVVQSTPFKAPVPPPPAKDTPAKFDRKLIRVVVMLGCEFYVLIRAVERLIF